MVDTDFEVDIAAAVKEKTTLRFTREVLEPVELKFETFSESFSNLNEAWQRFMAETEFNERWLALTRKIVEKINNVFGEVRKES